MLDGRKENIVALKCERIHEKGTEAVLVKQEKIVKVRRSGLKQLFPNGVWEHVSVFDFSVQ